METKPHRARVFKDPDHWPAWQVYYGNTWVGSAHSRVIAHAVARVVVTTACDTAEHNLTGWHIIRTVNRIFEDFKIPTMWVPGSPAITHTAHREYMRDHGRRHQIQHQDGKVIYQWAA